MNMVEQDGQDRELKREYKRFPISEEFKQGNQVSCSAFYPVYPAHPCEYQSCTLEAQFGNWHGTQ